MAAHVEYAVTVQNSTSRFRALPLNLSISNKLRCRIEHSPGRGSPHYLEAFGNQRLSKLRALCTDWYKSPLEIVRERSDIVVSSLEYLVRVRRATGPTHRSSLTGGTALCPWARHIYPCYVLFQPTRCQVYKSFHDCFVRINAYSLQFQLSRRFPAKIGYSRAFKFTKTQKSIPNFIESRPNDQNAYCSDICNT